MAVQIGCNGRIFTSFWQCHFAPRLNLCKSRDIGLAEHETDIWMCDELAARIHNIGLSAVADFDLRNYFPNEFEVDLSSHDTFVSSRTGHGDRHVWFRPVNKVDRSIIDLICLSVGEYRIVRKIG